MTPLIIFGAQYLVLIFVLFSAVFLWGQDKAGRMVLAVRALISFPATLLVARFASSFWYNARPFVVDHIQPLVEHAADNGFPSDHTLLAAACAALVLTHDREWGSGLYVL